MYEIILIVAMVVGVGLILYSMVLYSRSEAENNSSASNYFEAANTMKFVEASLDEINGTMDELGETSKYIFDEMEKKYQELLILYSLIDQKKKEMAGSFSKKETNYEFGVGLSTAPNQYEASSVGNSHSASPHIHKVRKMQEEGLSVEETARRLGIGKGEVQLLRDIGQGQL